MFSRRFSIAKGISTGVSVNYCMLPFAKRLEKLYFKTQLSMMQHDVGSWGGRRGLLAIGGFNCCERVGLKRMTSLG